MGFDLQQFASSSQLENINRMTYQPNIKLLEACLGAFFESDEEISHLARILDIDVDANQIILKSPTTTLPTSMNHLRF
jgi:hypothetical protein